MNPITWTAAAVTSGLLVLTGCTLPPDPGAGTGNASAPAEGETAAAATVPPNWPAAVPLFEDGTLITANSDEAGTFFSLTYHATSGSPKDVADTYGTVLVDAGFVAGEPFIDEISSLTTYTGNGYDVTVYASTPDETTTDLTVDVTPTP